MKGSSRRKIIWIGEPGQIARQFKSRNLQVDISELANTAPARESHWAKSCGLVVSYRLRPEYRTACEEALKLLDEALSFGLRVEILGEGAEAAHLEQALKTLGIATNSSVVVRTNYDRKRCVNHTWRRTARAPRVWPCESPTSEAS